MRLMIDYIPQEKKKISEQKYPKWNREEKEKINIVSVICRTN